MNSVVVVGTGIAGTTAASTLRQQGYDGRLTLVGSEPVAPYHRPSLSKQVLRGDKTVDAVPVKPPGWFTEHQVELLTGTTVSELDVGSRKVCFAGGKRLGYDALLLATGGRPRTLPAVAGVEGVHVLRNAADVPALHAALRSGGHVLVVGAGFLGAEVAASARVMGCQVTLLESASHPLGRLLPPSVAAFYSDLHRAHGVNLRTGAGLLRAERFDGGVRAAGTDGTTWDVDVVVVAVGMQPNTRLADDVGIAVSDGVVVDGRGRTSAPGVWSAGDVAAFPDRVTGIPRRLEHWQAAMTQGAVVAASMLGETSPWTAVPWCWSDQYGVNLQVCGHPNADDEVVLRGTLESGSFTAVYARDGLLTGAVAIDRPADLRVLRKFLSVAPTVPLALLGDEGTDLLQLLALAPAGTSHQNDQFSGKPT